MQLIASLYGTFIILATCLCAACTNALYMYIRPYGEYYIQQVAGFYTCSLVISLMKSCKRHTEYSSVPRCFFYEQNHVFCFRQIKVYAYFGCPDTSNENEIYCCGLPNEQYCCSYSEHHEQTRYRSRFSIWDIVVIVLIVIVLLMPLIVALKTHYKCKRCYVRGCCDATSGRWHGVFWHTT